jgi:hypothetical protein
VIPSTSEKRWGELWYAFNSSGTVIGDGKFKGKPFAGKRK